jgi:PAS domain-containing protein
VRNADGEVDGIFVLVADVTQRARAEAQLRLSNWQLGEERARLAAMIEAEQRAQSALRRFNDTLESHVKARTTELTRALQAQVAVAARLRATFATELMFQGFLDPAGTLLDANPLSLAAIRRSLHEVVGKPFWDTPWFTATPGAAELMRAAVGTAAGGQAVHHELSVNLPDGPRTFHFSLRPVFDDRQRVVGLVPEGVEIAAEPRRLAA